MKEVGEKPFLFSLLSNTLMDDGALAVNYGRTSSSLIESWNVRAIGFLDNCNTIIR